MALVDLNLAFPLGADGQRKALPKQAELLNKALSAAGPKYISYVGGIGSGKSLIGCITILSQAVLYPGDYLVCRQFYPELKVTTLKTFLEVCPKELIIEYRVADSLVKIHASGGKTSTVYFRPLEEPDKFRSMNLSGFLIDEANQVSEEAFILLQGRLRGPGLRKGVIVSNPAGHDWLYRWFVKKDHLKTDQSKAAYYLIQAPSTENIHLPDGYISSLMESWSEERIKREIQGSFDAFEGMVYNEFRRDVHVVRPFRIPEEWERHIRIDHGYRNPAAVLFIAVSPDGEAYVYKELYVREWLINEIVDGNKKERKFGMIDQIAEGERFASAKIDPSTKARRGVKGESDYDEYRRVWDAHSQLPVLGFAKNDVAVGIDRVKSYLKPHPKTKKPLLYIFSSCDNILEEITTYRYQEARAGDDGKKAEPESPVKANDHALDALRYMIIDLPEPYKLKEEDQIKKNLSNVSYRLYQEIQSMKNPPPKDPLEGI